MSETAIQVEDIAKQYRLGTARAPYRTLRESINRAVAAPFRRLRGRADDGPEAPLFWALKGVSFEVGQGEVVGIIGRNGAGKSTLLKVLSRVTEPTRGRVVLHGRMSSLLEVGTGFHPELTGRENVYLNGSILGMSRREIRRKFDAIVEFAEVSAFLDTPVKRYSSGMQMRLAFSVAAHLEPEILVVDEVLAVGDASFQKKCLNKMEEVGQEGRTVLFVSHSMTAVTRLCSRAILLDEGRAVADGPAHQVTGHYLRSGSGTMAAREWPDAVSAPGNEIVRLRAVRVRDEDGQVTEAADIRRPVGIEIEFDVLKPGHVLVPNCPFTSEEGVYLFHAVENDPEWWRRPRPAGRYVSTAWVPGNFLAEGMVVVGAAVSTMDPVTIHVFERDAVGFQVIDSLDGDAARGDYAGPFPGAVRPLLRWSNHFTPAARPPARVGVGDGARS